ncbi:MAG: ABC transporter permease [Gemmatimonadaceae bacterium]
MNNRSVWPNALRLAVRTIRRAKWQTLAMGATLAVGVLSITLTVATGEGARRGVEKSFRSMLGAFDVLLIQPGGPAMRGMARQGNSVTTLTADDIRALSTSVPNIREASMAQTEFKAPVDAAGKNGTTTLFGVTPNWFSIRGDSIAAGAPFTDDDSRTMSRVAVVGADIARTYFGSANTVGQRIRVSGIDFTIVGVLAANGAGPGGFSLDNLVEIPLETARRRVFNRENIDLATLKLARPEAWATSQSAVIELLRKRHQIRPPTLDDFQVTSPQAIIARVATVDSKLRRAFFWVGFLALGIGGVVVANLMYAAAAARRSEIGMRRAVGATSDDILAQFWAEAVLIALLAAITGTVLGVLLIQGGASMMRVPLALSWPVTLGTAAITLALGAFAGYFPARRAAALSPAVALRTSA